MLLFFGCRGGPLGRELASRAKDWHGGDREKKERTAAAEAEEAEQRSPFERPVVRRGDGHVDTQWARLSARGKIGGVPRPPANGIRAFCRSNYCCDVVFRAPP